MPHHRILSQGSSLFVPAPRLIAQVHPVLTLADDVVPGLTPRFSQSKLVETVAMRGLRVRMGLHSGLTDPQAWAVNKATGRWCASGEGARWGRRKHRVIHGQVGCVR